MDAVEFHLPPTKARSDRPYGLTPLQVEILQRVANGDRFKEMATPERDAKCIWNAMWHIRAKMGVVTSCEAVAKAVSEGFIQYDQPFRRGLLE